MKLRVEPPRPVGLIATSEHVLEDKRLQAMHMDRQLGLIRSQSPPFDSFHRCRYMVHHDLLLSVELRHGFVPLVGLAVPSPRRRGTSVSRFAGSCIGSRRSVGGHACTQSYRRSSPMATRPAAHSHGGSRPQDGPARHRPATCSPAPSRGRYRFPVAAPRAPRSRRPDVRSSSGACFRLRRSSGTCRSRWSRCNPARSGNRSGSAPLSPAIPPAAFANRFEWGMA